MGMRIAAVLLGKQERDGGGGGNRRCRRRRRKPICNGALGSPGIAEQRKVDRREND